MKQVVHALFGMLVVAGCASDAQPAGPTGVVPAGWEIYRNVPYRFSVAYPPDAVLLPEPTRSSGSTPPVIYRARFMNKDIAAGAFADRELPYLTIEVFERGAAATVRSWLDGAGRVPPGASANSAPNVSGFETIHVRLRQALAPNEFVYVGTDRYVYALIPLGDTGTRMAASFGVVD